eukprot:Sspe_Gene.16656::Locus_5877_Transcript_1_1_Confidence_1.000_Length_696::g.16656::m.16656/K20824/NAA38; N-alpha-acetyltransferase 38, NatC auxiliary subunit
MDYMLDTPAPYPIPGREKTAPTPEQVEAQETLNGLLEHPMRVEVEDGRVFIGNPVCFDAEGNIILIDVLECRSKEVTLQSGEKRTLKEQWYVTASIIPMKHIVKIEQEKEKGKLGSMQQWHSSCINPPSAHIDPVQPEGKKGRKKRNKNKAEPIQEVCEAVESLEVTGDGIAS